MLMEKASRKKYLNMKSALLENLYTVKSYSELIKTSSENVSQLKKKGKLNLVKVNGMDLIYVEKEQVRNLKTKTEA